MNRYTMRMLLRSIRGSLGRYLAILAIVALGVLLPCHAGDRGALSG